MQRKTSMVVCNFQNEMSPLQNQNKRYIKVKSSGNTSQRNANTVEPNAKPHKRSIMPHGKLTYLLSPLRACSHITPSPTSASFAIWHQLHPRAIISDILDYDGNKQTAPLTFSTSLLVVPSCFQRGSSAWLLLE